MQAKYTDHELRREINCLLDELQARGEPLRPQWVTHQVCLAHMSALVVDSEHAPFWEFSGYTLTRKLSTACINDREVAVVEDAEGAVEQWLPGFEVQFLQPYYVVTRDGEDVGWPVMDCTDDELIAKAALYRSQSRKLVAHADEIERFVGWRAAQSVNA
jgi:hypothetical protein